LLFYFYLGAASWIAVWSLVTFVVYGYDKRQARRDGRRIPEQRLHLLALAGGFPGAYLGQQYFRHKTQKTSFAIVTGAALLLHVALWLIVGWVLR
jgi:uncharacterized membrane protein YsdA (DUF1294 family)